MGERGKSWHFWHRTRGKATAVLRQWRGNFFPVVREDFSSGAAVFWQWWEFCLVGARQIGPIHVGQFLGRGVEVWTEIWYNMRRSDMSGRIFHDKF